MKALLIAAWVIFLGFIVWEFIFAGNLPEKYSKVSPSTFRLVDVAVTILVVATIVYIIKK